MALYIDKNVYVGDTGAQLGEIANKAPKSHASSGTTYGVGTTDNYGHCRVINNLTTASATNGYALQAYQGKVLNDKITKLQKMTVNSTTEQDTGMTWIDNKKIYRKVFKITAPLESTSTLSFAHGITNINRIWIANSFLYDTGSKKSYPLPINQYDGNTKYDRLGVKVDNTNITFLCETGWGNAWEKYVILEYTKTS